MGKDQTQDVAEEQLALMGLDVIVQLEKGSGTRPVLWLLIEARKRAAAAFVKFLTIDPTQAEEIRKLQNQVNIYDDLITDCRSLIARGREADRLIAENDRQEMEEMTGADGALDRETEPGVNDA